LTRCDGRNKVNEFGIVSLDYGMGVTFKKR
jgi:hypothetical protein